VSEPRDADSVAARLRWLRGTLGLSQEQLARRLGVSFASVNRWESGRTGPSARAAAALAELEAELAAGGARTGGADALPVAQSGFVGRPRELAELTRLIGQSPLVTLIGPGGAGKTRLAAEVLSRNVAHTDIVFVPLEQVRYPRSLASALASRLQVPDQHGRPLMESIRSALAAAATAVATTRLLVDSSWLVVTQGSEQNLFSTLETIRTFAALRLEQAGDGPAARRRHALHFAAIAAGSEQGLAGPDAAGWTSRLEAAVADLDAALHWADQNADVDLGLDIGAALWRWWLVSGRLAVGRNWLSRFLAQAGPREDELAGRALCSAAAG
jgi:predicted ATPase/DNA-binding XRE family transcriptional regulator